MSIVQLSMFFFVVAVSCDSFYIISKHFMFVNNFFKLFFVAFLNLSNSNSDILSYIFLLVNNFFEVFSKVIFKQNGERGIRTLAPVARPTPLAGAPLQPLEYFSMNRTSSLPICYWRHFVTQKLLYISSMLLSIAFFIIFLIVDIVYEYCRIASSIFVFTMSAISGVFNCLYSS